MLGWLKKHYSQVSQKNWYSCQNNDEFMLRPCSKQVKNQINQQKKYKLQKVIHQLGLTLGKDYNGKIVLKNNVPLRKQISQKQTNKLLKKLNTNKPSSFALDSLKQKSTNTKYVTTSQTLKNKNLQKKQKKQLIYKSNKQNF